jgi:hypothetical protein
MDCINMKEIYEHYNSWAAVAVLIFHMRYTLT